MNYGFIKFLKTSILYKKLWINFFVIYLKSETYKTIPP